MLNQIFQPNILEVSYINKSSEVHSVKRWKEKIRVKNCYDLTSDIYKKRYFKEQEKKYEMGLAQLDFMTDDFVLDLGCANGLLFPLISSKVGMVVGVDVSRELLHNAKKGVSESNIHLIQVDADHLPFQTGRFNIVFAFTVLQNMPSPLRTLKQIRLVTKEDGKVIVTALKKIFSIKAFFEILKKSGFNIISLEDVAGLKDNIYILQK